MLELFLLVAVMSGKFKVDDRVVTEYGGKLYKATVVALNKNQYQIKYDSDGSAQWRNEEKLAPLDATNEAKAVGVPPPPPKAVEAEYKAQDQVWIDIR